VVVADRADVGAVSDRRREEVDHVVALDRLQPHAVAQEQAARGSPGAKNEIGAL
jgi:hypothetical protein